jgi:hypothetical protein
MVWAELELLFACIPVGFTVSGRVLIYHWELMRPTKRHTDGAHGQAGPTGVTAHRPSPWRVARLLKWCMRLRIDVLPCGVFKCPITVESFAIYDFDLVSFRS